MDTQERQIQRYHSVTGRPTIDDALTKRRVWASFSRTIGPWLPTDRGARILDVGCGEGALLVFLRERGYGLLEGFDLSPECVDLSRGMGLTFVKCFDLLRLAEWPGGGYDLIFFLDVIEHLPKRRAVEVLEVARKKLAPGGGLIIQTPNLGSIMGTYCSHSDLTHEFGLTEKSVRDLLTLAGFPRELVEVRPAWNAATTVGRLREVWLWLVHRILFLAEDVSRPRIPTKNLLVRAVGRG